MHMDYAIAKLSWNDVTKSVLNLAKEVKDIDTIVTIGRGGNIPGTMLGYKLGTKNIVNFGIQSYNDDKTAEKITIQQTPNISDLKGKKVLVVDDLADKGTTLKYVKEYLETHNINPTFCTLYIKKGTGFVPNYYTETFNDDVWIEFPWDDLTSCV